MNHTNQCISKAFRRIIWTVVVENSSGLGGEALFEFKYIPDLSKGTVAEKSAGYTSRRSATERRNLLALLSGCFIFCFVGWVIIKAFSLVWGGFASHLASLHFL